MSLVATVVDPLTEPAPSGWGDFTTNEQLLPVWHDGLIRTADWCTQNASSLALVTEAGSGQPVAAFHARHLGATSPYRLARVGRVPPVTLTEVRSVPMVGTGVAFATGADQRDRREAVRVFERALGSRVGLGGRFIAYRGLPTDHLSAVSATGRVRKRLSSMLVIHNQWSDFAGYMASLPAKWRSQLKKIRQTVATNDSLQVAHADSIEPEDAAWLAELVRRRHLSRAFARPPYPSHYYQQLSQLAGSSFITYRDRSGRLIAFSSLFDGGDEIRLGAWGLRPEADGGQRDLYFDQYLRMIELMIERGRARLVLGMGMADIKMRYGATAEPRWGLVGLR